MIQWIVPKGTFGASSSALGGTMFVLLWNMVFWGNSRSRGADGGAVD